MGGGCSSIPVYVELTFLKLSKIEVDLFLTRAARNMNAKQKRFFAKQYDSSHLFPLE